ncbi:DinB family protein [Roseobacter sinensis]|uniref:DinB family protein n=1 Tax=Roseobacter sinensis TaxID=2931391 RepID=A0ABT3BDV8_9RHOB|nr:DinB family protein [Roseobacter sp. WL0113]MCV3271765.1 DinB family protein [Roseobacter sp. WL0113]
MTAQAPQPADAFRRMAENNAWANATFYDAARRLPDGRQTDPVPGFFPTLAATLNHIYEVDLYYVDALEQGGKGYTVFEREEVTSLDALAALQASLDRRLIAFCQALTADKLIEMRDTERPGTTIRENVQALLLHLFQHQVHHRGQAHVQLQTLGIAPPQLDDFHLSFERAPTAEAYWR